MTNANYSYAPGIALLAIASLLYFLGRNQQTTLNQNDYLSIMAFSAVMFWIGGFVFFYGVKASKIALFPLLFLFFMVPVPSILMDGIILLLQIGSTAVTYVLLKLTGTPVIREGFTFHLPGISIQVAKECSGIRSSIALVITGVIACALFLRSVWGRSILIVSLGPLVVIKNGMRIVTLSLLGLYVDEKFIGGSSLHMRGGVIFFMAALVLFGAILWLLRRWEAKQIK